MPVLRPLLVLLVVAACALPPPIVYPEIGFADRAPIRIAASLLEVVDLYRPPLRPPHVEHLAPAIPSIVVRRWAEQRLVPVGGAARLRVTIEDARIVETPLAVDDSLTGVLTVEQAARLDGRVAVTVALIGPAGEPLASASGEATRARTVPEDATLNEREELMFQIVEDLAAALDEVLSANVRRYFADYMR